MSTTVDLLKSAEVIDVPIAGDISAMLSGLSAEKPAGKKSKVPIVSELKAEADEAVRKKIALKQAETEFKLAEEALLEPARAIYARFARQGCFSKSINLAGEQTGGVRVSFTDRFSALPATDKPELIAALGERFDVLFQEKRTLTLKTEKTDDDSIRFLLERLGPQTFSEYFDVQVTIHPKPGMDREQFSLPEAVRDRLTQFKPSVVVR